MTHPASVLLALGFAAVTTPALGGEPDTLWFGGRDADTGLAIAGGVWGFEDGSLQGWTSVDRTDEGLQIRPVHPDSHLVHGDPADCSIDGGSIWFGSHADGVAGQECWPGGQGYGNQWVQSLSRSFDYAGSGPVVLTYDYFVEMAPDYPDLVYVYSVVDGERRGPHNADDCPDPDGDGYGGCGTGTPALPGHETIVLSPADLPEGREASRSSSRSSRTRSGPTTIHGSWSTRSVARSDSTTYG